MSSYVAFGNTFDAHLAKGRTGVVNLLRQIKLRFRVIG